MKPSSPHDDALFEHRFWLQVLGDHARFIHTSLAPTEVTEIRRAQRFIEVFDSLLARARQNLHDSALTRLHTHAYKVAKRLREFKLHLLRRHLASEVEMSLSPSFLNHMVNENEEYLRIIGCWLEGQQTPLMNPLHHHQLWLQDAYGHSATLAQTVDFSEFDLKRKSDRFTHDFQALYLKAIELAGYLRTHLDHFPALARFNRQVDWEMRMFQAFLQELRGWELTDEVLGALSPLMPDHMFREECYYLIKLSEVSDIPHPACDPTRPRVEQPPR